MKGGIKMLYFPVEEKQRLIKSIIERVYSGDTDSFKRDYMKIYLFNKDKDIPFNITSEQRKKFTEILFAVNNIILSDETIFTFKDIKIDVKLTDKEQFLFLKIMYPYICEVFDINNPRIFEFEDRSITLTDDEKYKFVILILQVYKNLSTEEDDFSPKKLFQMLEEIEKRCD